jgi:hypothetical protein
MATQHTNPLQPVHNLKPYKRVQGTHQIEHFFRAAAELDVDKEDIKRYYEFVDHKIADLLLIAQHTAKSNDRITVEPRDLPITKGLQESTHAFEKLDLDIGLERILDKTVPEPQIDLPYSEETEARLPGNRRWIEPRPRPHLKIIDPEVKHPATQMWERAFEVFNLLLYRPSGTGPFGIGSLSPKGTNPSFAALLNNANIRVARLVEKLAMLLHS